MTPNEKVEKLAQEVVEGRLILTQQGKMKVHPAVAAGTAWPACREYSGILRGQTEIVKELRTYGYISAVGVIAERAAYNMHALIDTWKRTLKEAP